MQQSVHTDHNMEDKKALLILVLLATLCGEIRGKAIFGKDVATLWDKIRGEAIVGKDVDDNNDDNGDSASDLIYKANSILKNQTNSLFEEDILVDTARKEEVEEWISGTTTSKRAALLGDYRWPENTLYYRFNSDFLHAHDVFLEAIQEIASKSCIKFQEGSSPKGYYVSVGSADGCSSYIGNLEIKGQELSIGDGCNYKGIIVHELLHALGFWHEQSRPDRDEYITVQRENIRSAFLNNFVKHVENEVEELGVPYDYDSVMHYGRKAFSRNDLDTIVPKGNPDRNIGQRNGLSTGDAEELRKYYNCPSNIPSPVAPGSMSCDFETGFCLWRNFDGEGKFLINKGPTRSSGTGPSGDHTSGTGQYIYFETSSPAVEGDSALIRSEQLMPSDNICVEFWYSMYGSTMGKLEMVTVTDLDSSTLPQARWSREGDQKETWKEARVTVSCQQPFYIIFKGTRGYSWRSDIALDDIAISPGPC